MGLNPTQLNMPVVLFSHRIRESTQYIVHLCCVDNQSIFNLLIINLGFIFDHMPRNNCIKHVFLYAWRENAHKVNMALTVKAYLKRGENVGKEIRRFSVDPTVAANYEYMSKKVAQVFPSLGSPDNFTLAWKGQSNFFSLFWHYLKLTWRHSWQLLIQYG